MRGRIHRGAQEIGGTCLELEAFGKRIALDIGLPLDQEASEVLVPPVSGFREPDKRLLAVAISHPHQDHYGLAQYLRPEIPILIGEAAHRILEAASHFGPAGTTFRHVRHLKDRKAIGVGPFRITPYLVDHSAYDAYALLVEVAGKRLFYSGDVRGHGRKAGAFERLLRQPPPNVDVLVLEGTTIGRTQAEAFPRERDLEAQFIAHMRGTRGLCLVWVSGQNIDRIVTIFRACKRARRQLVLDLYTAEVLRATGNPKIPQGDWDGVRVYLPEAQRRLVRRKALFASLNRYRSHRLFPEHLAEEAGRSVLLFRPSMAVDLERAKCLKEARLIYSLWAGYLKEKRLQSFREWLKRMRIPLTHIHTSGHASVADLKRLARAIRPKCLVPIHSAGPGRFAELFDRVEQKHDGVWWGV